MVRRVLVIDDDRPVRRLLVDFVTVMGYEVDAAADGVEGLALFERAKHDLVVTDVRMPGVNGWDVVRAVRRLRPDVGVVVVSGIETDLRHAGDDIARLPRIVLLTKPVGLDQLRDGMRRALGEEPQPG